MCNVLPLLDVTFAIKDATIKDMVEFPYSLSLMIGKNYLYKVVTLVFRFKCYLSNQIRTDLKPETRQFQSPKYHEMFQLIVQVFSELH